MQGGSIDGTTVGRDLGGAHAVLGSGHGCRPVTRTIARERGFCWDMFLIWSNFWDWGKCGTRFSVARGPWWDLRFQGAVHWQDGRGEADCWVWRRLEQVIKGAGGAGGAGHRSVDEFVD